MNKPFLKKSIRGSYGKKIFIAKKKKCNQALENLCLNYGKKYLSLVVTKDMKPLGGEYTLHQEYPSDCFTYKEGFKSKKAIIHFVKERLEKVI